MKVHISNVYGFEKSATVQVAQHMVADIATQRLGWKELGIFSYGDYHEPEELLSARLDGIIASVQEGDILVLQHPLWINLEYEEKLVDRFLTYSHGKLCHLCTRCASLDVSDQRLLYCHKPSTYTIVQIV